MGDNIMGDVSGCPVSCVVLCLPAVCSCCSLSPQLGDRFTLPPADCLLAKWFLLSQYVDNYLQRVYMLVRVVCVTCCLSICSYEYLRLAFSELRGQLMHLTGRVGTLDPPPCT